MSRPPRPSLRDLVPNGVLGNGSLLATLSRRGRVEQVWWPHVDRDPHLGELRLAVRDLDGLHWLDDPQLDHVQRHDGDTSVLVTDVAGPTLAVTVTDLVLPDEPVLVRRVTGSGGLVAVHVRPELAGVVRAGGAFVDPATGILVFHRRDRVLAVGMDVPATADVAERHREPGADSRLESGTLRGVSVVHGEVDGALLSEVPGDATVVVALADSPRAAVERVTAARDIGPEVAHAARRQADAAELARSTPVLVSGDAAQLDRRGQLVFGLVADRASGGVLAAPEQDPDFVYSGGYGFVWARDLAFVMVALLASGREDLAVPALRWLARAQGEDGLWLQRNWTDGTLAPSWGTQLDETGAVLAAYEQAWQHLGDLALDAELWPSAAAGADALVGVLDPETGLPAPSMDLWEERVGLHAFTAATAWAGLSAAAAMAQRHDPARAQGWLASAERVRAGIFDHLWSEEHGRFLRSIQVAREDSRGAPVPSCYRLLDHPARPVGSVDPVDAVVDVSLLGLAYPYAVLPADDPRMAATIAAVERELSTADGGLRRYEDDDYLGGNPWVLARLWLGLVRRTPGAPVPADGVDYALRARTSTDLLPEQVDAKTGGPAWIVPLTWSHAMYALACRPDPVAVLPGPDRAATVAGAS